MAAHGRDPVCDCHSIRSVIPRPFDGRRPAFDIGTNGGTSCAPESEGTVADVCSAGGRSLVVNGRFRGRSITRRLGGPAEASTPSKMELGCRACLRDAGGPVGAGDRPTLHDDAFAGPTRGTLEQVLRACLAFTRAGRRQMGRMSGAPRVDRFAGARCMPWATGGGETVEVAVHPPGGAFGTFSWRVGLAAMTDDGPFSTCHDVDRTFAVLEGDDMLLTVGAGLPTRLDAGDEPVRCAGEAPCRWRPSP